MIVERFEYDAAGVDLTQWNPKLGCAGKLVGKKINDGRRVKPDQPAQAQPSLLQSCNLLLAAFDYFVENDIRMFRLPSTFCPYATHPDYPKMRYIRQADRAGHQIAQLRQRLADYPMRLSFHPSQFVLLSSSKPQLTKLSREELFWQADFLDRLDCNLDARVLLHGGGVYNNRPQTQKRIIKNILKLPNKTKRRFALENDEYSWSVKQLLPIAHETNTPLIFDLHHHLLNPNGMHWADALHACLDTWPDGVRPKVHLSSSRQPDGHSVALLRPHSDYIDPTVARGFFYYADQHGLDFDVMLEAKQKDKAILQLREDLAGISIAQAA